MAKEGIHPNYRDVLFVDLSNGFKFVTRSCVNTKEMGKTDDGRELPLFKLDTSSESHPFYTGTQKSVNDMGGRVDKFFKKFGKTGRQVSSPHPKGQPLPRCPFSFCTATDHFRVNQPTPAIVAQSAVRRLPRHGAAAVVRRLCAARVHRPRPWKNADMMAFGYMFELAQGTEGSWLARSLLLGQPPEFDAAAALLAGRLGHADRAGLGDPDFAVRMPFIGAAVLTLLATWYGVYYLARTPNAQPVPLPSAARPIPPTTPAPSPTAACWR
jgi:large subunit ribosomal protein L31